MRDETSKDEIEEHEGRDGTKQTKGGEERRGEARRCETRRKKREGEAVRK